MKEEIKAPTKADPDESDHGMKTRLAELAKGLAHPARVEIVRMLAHMPPDTRCICGDIVKTLPLAQSSVSQHLKILKETGWIQGAIDGPRVCYCISDGILETCSSLFKKLIAGTDSAVK
jgi:predicted transcriptional regulator